MRHSVLSILAFLLALSAMYCGAHDGHRENGGRNFKIHHGGHRRQRSTRVIGNGIQVQHEAPDGSAVSTASSASFTTTSDSDSSEEEDDSGSAYEFHPGKMVYTSLPGGGISATSTSTARLKLNKFMTTVEGPAPVLLQKTVAPPPPLLLGKVNPPVPFIRPLGELPLPADRFGFDGPPRVDLQYALPNCGCLQMGRCVGEVGAYTQRVLPYTDIVCGLEFQTCCFDGPYPGTHDAFANVASCVPTELCLRPYGVLPTDVRDFGAIAPCPGQGVVRCIAVDSVGLLEFRAALAAIEASSVSEFRQDYHVNPTHLVVPLLTKGAKSGSVEAVAEATASVSVGSQSREKVQPPQTIVIKSPPGPVSSTTHHVYDHQPTPNVFVIQVPSYQPQAPTPVEGERCKLCEVVEKNRPEAPEPPAAVVPPAPPVVVPAAPVTRVQPYGYYRSPYLGGLYPGFGYGAGLGFHKHFQLSKGFGFGFGK